MKDEQYWVWDHKTVEQFKDLEKSKTFNEEIVRLRRISGIPENGFDVEKSRSEKGYFFIDINNFKKNKPQFKKEINKFFKKYPNHLHGILTDYLFKGFDLGISGVVEDMSSFGCSFQIKDDKIVINVYPGAVREDIDNFLDDYWSDIVRILKEKFPESYNKRIKTKTKRKRDDDIISLFDAGILKPSGVFNKTVAKQFLIEQGVEMLDRAILIKDFRDIGFPLPSVDVMKKVIAKTRKLRK